jgi:hypothetical protein
LLITSYDVDYFRINFNASKNVDYSITKKVDDIDEEIVCGIIDKLLDLALFGVLKRQGRHTNGSLSEPSGLVSRRVVHIGIASLN